MKKVRWGILGAAKIAREKVIPAMQAGEFSEVVALASRDEKQAFEIAAKLHIPVAFGSYSELLASPDVDAVYIPLPNHLHVAWSLKAIAAGKHVLCEKPIALSSAEAQQLLQAADAQPHLKVMEAFMYRFHPQWQTAKKLANEGRIGTVKTIQSFFSYFNNNPADIRNQQSAGGGGLMDIGCYCISLARFLINKEPERVLGMIENDPSTHVDRVASGMLDFGNATSTFTCSTQLMPSQRVNILGTEGRIDIELPFSPPASQAARIHLHTKTGMEEFTFAPVDQYTLQGDAFSGAIIHNTAVPVPLQDAVNNMRVIEAVFASAKSQQWQIL